MIALHFLRPWWWLALLPLPVMLYALARSGGGRGALARLADAALLPHLVRDTSPHRRWALLLAGLAWLLAVGALSGPAWQRAPAPLYANGAARVVALSLSGDMRAQDLKPDRMTRARYAVRDLLDTAGDARVALIGYAGDAFVVAPLTPDRQTVLNLLDALSPDVMPAPGNDGARAIEQSLALLQQAHVRGGEIVLVTDDADDAAVEAARKARAGGVRVDVLGIGTRQGAPVPLPEGGFARDSGGVHIAQRDDSALRDVASAGGGQYAPLREDGSGVAALGAPAASQGSDAMHQQADIWRDGGVWLLLPLLPLAALAFRRGWLCVLALTLVTPFAHASVWDSLWARPDQRASQALHRGDYTQAGKLARDPQLKGAAAYRRSDYASAEKYFAQGDTALSQYNFGNALARSGHFKQALAAYDRALKRDPQFADARANREAVLAWLKAHPPQSRQAGDQGTQGNPSGQSQKGSGSSSQGSQQGSQNGHGSGKDARNQHAQAGSGDGHSSDAQNADSAAGKAPNGGQGAGDSGASVAEDAQQRAQLARAQQALQREMATRQPNAASGRHSRDGQGAYALGAASPGDDEGKFNPQQRAMLNAVPDDPGALLRRKFMLEWQRRHGQQPDEGQ